jgi:adenylylsulfate kinase
MPIKRPYTLWLMGPTSSGKSTIAENFVNILKHENRSILHYDGDEIRNFFGEDFGFNESNRGRVVECLAQLAKKANEAGIDTIVSALTAHHSARDYIKDLLPNLLIGYVNCPIEICAERDPKGLYEKARNGEIDTLIGYNSEYIPPSSPDIILDTESSNIDDNVQQLIKFLEISSN